MNAFLYLDLTVAAHPVAYEQADVQLVKAHFPGIALLDIDAASDELLVHYARRMIQEATQMAVCIKADETASFKIIISLLEDLLQAKGQQLILLRGENKRLQRILEARPQLNVKQVSNETDLLAELELFFTF